MHSACVTGRRAQSVWCAQQARGGEARLSSLHTVNLGGLELAIEAAKNFRKLRAL
jgi:hypothetical protein